MLASRTWLCYNPGRAYFLPCSASRAACRRETFPSNDSSSQAAARRLLSGHRKSMLAHYSYTKKQGFSGRKPCRIRRKTHEKRYCMESVPFRPGALCRPRQCLYSRHRRHGMRRRHPGDGHAGRAYPRARQQEAGQPEASRHAPPCPLREKARRHRH